MLIFGGTGAGSWAAGSFSFTQHLGSAPISSTLMQLRALIKQLTEQWLRPLVLSFLLQLV